MDALGGLLEGTRARAAFLLRSRMRAPWSLGIEDEAPLTVVSVVSGRVWLRSGELAEELGPGDVAVLRGPDPYVLADDPDRPPQAVILPGQVCSAPGGGPQSVMGPLGLREWGNDAAGDTELLTGTYAEVAEVSRRLVRALPAALVLRAEEWDCPVVPLLAAEIGRDDPGQEAVLDRLLDLLLIAVLRAWFARPEADAPGWYAAHGDPVVGPALRHLQQAPERAWTLDLLARTVGASRATLARRFAEAVGQPPMAFLTEWRLALAADLLREPEATVESVARRVGYATPFALSAAFKRVRGVSPSAHRAAG